MGSCVFQSWVQLHHLADENFSQRISTRQGSVSISEPQVNENSA